MLVDRSTAAWVTAIILLLAVVICSIVAKRISGSWPSFWQYFIVAIICGLVMTPLVIPL